MIGISRILALYHYYHAPLSVAFDLQFSEVPRLLNVTGLLPVYPEGTSEDDTPRIDLTPIKEMELTLCLGKEWHRFSGNYLVPNGIKVEFIKSEFNGMLPRHFEENLTADDELPEVSGESTTIRELSKNWWIKPQTTYVPQDLNDLNKEDTSHYVSLLFLNSKTMMHLQKHSVYLGLHKSVRLSRRLGFPPASGHYGSRASLRCYERYMGTRVLPSIPRCAPLVPSD